MKIKLKNILEILNELRVNYIFESEYSMDEEYTVSSIFNPISEGFYFAKLFLEIPSEIKNSILLVDETINHQSSNKFIRIKQGDTQQIFYLILNKLFSQKSNGIIAKTSMIHPNAKIGKNVQIDDFSIIGNCTIGDNVIISSHCKIYDHTVIGNNTIIESFSAIGTQGVAWVWNENQTERIIEPQLGGVEIGINCFLGANSIIVRGSLNENTKVGDQTLIAPSSRIGHGTQIEEFVHLANNICTGGNVKIGSYSFVGSGVIFRPKTKIHSKTIVGAGALVIKNTSKEGVTLIGSPATEVTTKINPAGMPKPKI